jgi:hypothetical protein
MKRDIHMKKRNYYLFGSLVIVAVLFFILGMGSNPGRGKADNATPVQTIVIKDEAGFSTAISEVADALIDAVVHINVAGTVVQRGPDFGCHIAFSEHALFQVSQGIGIVKELFHLLMRGIVVNIDIRHIGQDIELIRTYS